MLQINWKTKLKNLTKSGSGEQSTGSWIRLVNWDAGCVLDLQSPKGRAVDIIRGQFFAGIHCEVHLLAGKLIDFPMAPRATGCYVLLFRFWSMSGIVNICGDSRCTLLVLVSILSWTCLPPFRRLIASPCWQIFDLTSVTCLYQNFCSSIILLVVMNLLKAT